MYPVRCVSHFSGKLLRSFGASVQHPTHRISSTTPDCCTWKHTSSADLVIAQDGGEESAISTKPIAKLLKNIKLVFVKSIPGDQERKKSFLFAVPELVRSTASFEILARATFKSWLALSREEAVIVHLQQIRDKTQGLVVDLFHTSVTEYIYLGRANLQRHGSKESHSFHR